MSQPAGVTVPFWHVDSTKHPWDDDVLDPLDALAPYQRPDVRPVEAIRDVLDVAVTAGILAGPGSVHVTEGITRTDGATSIRAHLTLVMDDGEHLSGPLFDDADDPEDRDLAASTILECAAYRLTEMLCNGYPDVEHYYDQMVIRPLQVELDRDRLGSAVDAVITGAPMPNWPTPRVLTVTPALVTELLDAAARYGIVRYPGQYDRLTATELTQDGDGLFLVLQAERSGEALIERVGVRLAMAVSSMVATNGVPRIGPAATAPLLGALLTRLIDALNECPIGLNLTLPAEPVPTVSA